MTEYRSLPPPKGECVLFTGHIMSNGYGQKQSFGRVTSAHRAVMEQRMGRRLLRKEVVCHLCDTRPCVNPEHLHIGTNSDNIQDAIAKGRSGVRNRAKLSDDDVRCIRAAARVPGFNKALAQQFGVSPQCISNVRAGRYYTHVR